MPLINVNTLNVAAVATDTGGVATTAPIEEFSFPAECRGSSENAVD